MDNTSELSNSSCTCKTTTEKSKKRKITTYFCPEIWITIFPYLEPDDFQKIRILSKEIFQLPWKYMLHHIEFHFPTKYDPNKEYDMSFVTKLKLDSEHAKEHFFKNEKLLGYLKDIKDLNLFLTQIDDKALSFLLRSPNQIEKLSLSSCHRITNECMKFCNNLKELNLSGTNITDEGLVYLSQIEKIDLSMCKITDQGLSNLKKVRSIKLYSCNKVTDKGLESLEELEELMVEGNKNLTDNCLSKVKKLKILFLKYCPRISYQVFEKLTDLEELDVEGIKQMDQGVKYLKKVKKLKVNLSDIQDQSLIYLKEVRELSISKCKNLNGCEFEYLKNLVSLDLSSNSFLKDSHLLNFQNLERLNLQDCMDITDEGIDKLGGIKNLNIRNCIKVTDQGLKNLKNIVSLNIKGCKKITGIGFQYLGPSIRELIIGDGNKDLGIVNDQMIEYIGKYLSQYLERIGLLDCEKISSSSLIHLKGIKYFEFSNCLQIDYIGLSNLKGAKEFYLFAVGVSEKDLEKLRNTIGLKRWRGVY